MSSNEKLEVELVSPEKKVFSKDADMVIISGTEGDFGVLPGHAPIISTIRPGSLEIQESSDTERMFVAGGIVEVLDDKVSILATEVINKDDIDVSNCETKISDYTAKMQTAENEVEKENNQKLINKYQSMIEFKNL